MELPLVLVIACDEVHGRLEVRRGDRRRKRDVVADFQRGLVRGKGSEERERIIRVIQPPRSSVDLRAVVVAMRPALVGQVRHARYPQRVVEVAHRRVEMRFVGPVASHDDPAAH